VVGNLPVAGDLHISMPAASQVTSQTAAAAMALGIIKDLPGTRVARLGETGGPPVSVSTREREKRRRRRRRRMHPTPSSIR
jgi:hypothetical protein